MHTYGGCLTTDGLTVEALLPLVDARTLLLRVEDGWLDVPLPDRELGDRALVTTASASVAASLTSSLV